MSSSSAAGLSKTVWSKKILTRSAASPASSKSLGAVVEPLRPEWLRVHRDEAALALRQLSDDARHPAPEGAHPGPQAIL